MVFQRSGRLRTGMRFAGSVVCCLLAACGCLSRTSPPTRHYRLSALTTPDTVSAERPSLDCPLVVGPIHVPEYLRRSGFVRAAGAHELQIATFDEWAEPLETALPRVLLQELSVRLRPPRASLFRDPVSLDSALQVMVQIQRFEADTAGKAHLQARVQLVGPGETPPNVLAPPHLEEPCPVGDAAAQAAAMSRLLSRLAEHIAHRAVQGRTDLAK